MNIFSDETNIIIQGLLAIVIIGTMYSLFQTSKEYGGMLGKALRLIGAGTLFLTIALIERSLIIFTIIPDSVNLGILGDILSVLALMCLGFGFSRMASAGRP